MSVISTLQPASLGCFHGLLAEEEEEELLKRLSHSLAQQLEIRLCRHGNVPRRWSSICHKQPLRPHVSSQPRETLGFITKQQKSISRSVSSGIIFHG